MKCPKCGNNKKNMFSFENENDFRDDLCVCKKCGHVGKRSLFQDSSELQSKSASGGNFSDNKDKMPSNEGNAGIPFDSKTREKDKKCRKKPESRLNSKLDPTADENVRRVSMKKANSNPFIKKSELEDQGRNYILQEVLNSFQESGVDDPFSKVKIMNHIFSNGKKAVEKYDEILAPYAGSFGVEILEPEGNIDDFHGENIIAYYANSGDTYNGTLLYDVKNDRLLWTTWGDFLEDYERENKSFEEPEIEASSKSNPFVKTAREFRYTEDQKKKKEISQNNMVFPEGIQDKENNSGEGKSGNNNGYKYYDFDTVDRKEMRSSPDPKQFIPGHAEWVEKEVDEYYDGWVDDHIENSGGKVVGSNTEKVMNLDDGERAHAPEFPTEAVYEALLESRHELDGDLVKVVAEGKTYTFKKAQVEQILSKVPNNDDIDINDENAVTEKILSEIESGLTDQFIREFVLTALTKEIRSSDPNYLKKIINPGNHENFASSNRLVKKSNDVSLEERFDGYEYLLGTPKKDYINPKDTNSVIEKILEEIRSGLNDQSIKMLVNSALTNEIKNYDPYYLGQIINGDHRNFASSNPFIKQSSPESKDKLKITEERLECEEPNAKRVFKKEDEGNMKKRKNVHSQFDANKIAKKKMK